MTDSLTDVLQNYNLRILLLLTIGFTAASIFGYFAKRIKLSPILGFLLAGYVIGPFSPGFVADLAISEQLAEIGVILMMFGVGLHFKVQDLMNVKNIAIPGAIGQTLASALIGALFIYLMGWPVEIGIILGLAIGVASTVVLVRMLSDHHLLRSKQGHIAVGWLIVEDIITVLILLVLPSVASIFNGNGFSFNEFFSSLGIVFLKFIVLTLFIMTLGKRTVSYLLNKVVKTHSDELFTLSLLAIIFLIAVGTSLLFDISMALGAFIAGMVIGQTEVRHKALVHSLPMKDTFVVIFFLSVGMLFNPAIFTNHFGIFLGVLAIIMIVKPLVAFFITLGFKYPMQIAFTVACALAQIGEFSFILSEEALKYKLMSDDGYDIIVACAFVSIALNPLFFNFIPKEHDLKHQT